MTKHSSCYREQAIDLGAAASHIRIISYLEYVAV